MLVMAPGVPGPPSLPSPKSNGSSGPVTVAGNVTALHCPTEDLPGNGKGRGGQLVSRQMEVWGAGREEAEVRPAHARPPGPRQPADVSKTGPESSLSSPPTKARPLRDEAGGGKSAPPAALPHLQGLRTPSCETGEVPHRGLPGKRRRALRGPPASSSRLAPDPDVPQLRCRPH